MEKGKKYLVIYIDDRCNSHSKDLVYKKETFSHYIFDNPQSRDREEGILKTNIVRWQESNK